MQALQSLVGDDLPRVFDDLRPTPDVGPPPASSGLTQEVTDAVVPSVVKVEGEACGRIQDGSGFVVAPGLVVTNAHVVAGEERSDVLTSSGQRLPGVAVAFDPDRDLAVLSVAGLDAPGLPLADATDGDIGGVFGFPGGGDLRIAPFSVVRQIRALGRDIYDDGRTEREVLELAADLAPGDSGSALVAPDGTVIGVAFAIAPDRPGVAYALTVDELEAVLAGDLSSAVSTGPLHLTQAAAHPASGSPRRTTTAPPGPTPPPTPPAGPRGAPPLHPPDPHRRGGPDGRVRGRGRRRSPSR